MIRKSYIDTTKGQVHYRSMGEGAVVVLLHQTASSSRSMEPLMPLLANRFRVLAFDSPGFGESFYPEEILGMDFFIETLTEALDNLEVEGFHLFGHHTGACIAIELAVKLSSRVKSCILSGPLPLTSDEQKKYHQMISSPMSPDIEGKYLLKTFDYLKGHGLDRDLQVLHREFLDHCRAWRTRSLTYDIVWFQDFWSLLERIDVPTLLMCAENDLLWEYFLRSKSIRPDLPSVVLPSAGNFCTDFATEETAKAIIGFSGRLGSMD